MACGGWWINKLKKKKWKKGNFEKWQNGERERVTADCGEVAHHLNFDLPFGWPNDVRFDPKFEEVFYSTR